MRHRLRNSRRAGLSSQKWPASDRRALSRRARRRCRPQQRPAGRHRPRGFIVGAAPSAPSCPELTHKAFEKFGFSAAALITDWPQIAGADLAALDRARAPQVAARLRHRRRCRGWRRRPPGRHARRSASIRPARSTWNTGPARSSSASTPISATAPSPNCASSRRRCPSADGRLPPRAPPPTGAAPQLADIADDPLARALARLEPGSGARPGARTAALTRPSHYSFIQLAFRLFCLNPALVACYSGLSTVRPAPNAFQESIAQEPPVDSHRRPLPADLTSRGASRSPRACRRRGAAAALARPARSAQQATAPLKFPSKS